MKRSALTRKTPLSRGKPLQRRKPVAPANKARRARRRAEQFGERAQIVRAMACLLKYRFLRVPAGRAIRCEGDVQAAHVRSRGAGGDRRDLVPLCGGHHRQQHALGIQTFSEIYRVDLKASAATIAADLDERGVP